MMKIRIIDVDKNELLTDGFDTSYRFNLGDEITLDENCYEIVSIHHNLNKSYTELYVREI